MISMQLILDLLLSHNNMQTFFFALLNEYTDISLNRNTITINNVEFDLEWEKYEVKPEDITNQIFLIRCACGKELAKKTIRLQNEFLKVGDYLQEFEFSGRYLILVFNKEKMYANRSRIN